MKVYILCKHIYDTEDLHRMLREALCFPPHYGNNLDALYDCLTDLHRPVTLILCDSIYLKDRLGDYATKFARVLKKAAMQNPRFSFHGAKSDVLIF